jgi:arsenate reductase
MELTIYFNPECSKCQGACNILDTGGIPARRINYLLHPLSEKEIEELLQKLGMSAEELVRKSEPLYLEKFAGKHFSGQEWVKILHQNPILIQRPIVVLGGKAVIARPPEKLLELLRG